MNPKVSVIVPIYKVEKYLSRCIESILKQTYTNLEIILVDDGSPDQCGKIAEQYAERDKRIKVFHKKNGGLSDARNFGMQFTTGEYTMFVDSDDWLKESMVENMVYASKKYNADVVQSAFYYAYDQHLLFDNRIYSQNDPPVVLDNKALMRELVINETVKNFAWGKLYKTKMIKNLAFKKGVLFEDVFWAHKVMQRVNIFVILNTPLYYYYQRDDSIVANYSIRNLDIIKGLKERHSFIEENYSDLTKESYKLLLKTSLVHYNLLLQNRKKDQGALGRKEIQQYIKRNFPALLKAVEDEKHLKQQLVLFKINPYLNVLYLFLYKVLLKLRVPSRPSGLEKINLH
ncbi:glycosyltransferase family 2 protein [Neobacillus niacini]|uniref:glycosyltransferase family 2 protein n=1 Tax=Neobacillus niacini TaxID=86668 RepID=UPI00286CC48A|nr:glycosyltransferase family 2 protein [Neobacillus niacini]